jgi:8-oxo-dGTP diphosphatase
VTLEVVAAAIVRDGRVLAARRRHDGRWEFPGGKVEDGETARQAVARECREELGIDISVGGRIAVAHDRSLELTVYAAVLGHTRPAAGADHDQLCWLPAAELPSLDWLPLDRAVLDAVAMLLHRDPSDGEP